MCPSDWIVELYCFIVLAQHRETNMDRRGKRAQEGSKQHECRLECDREQATQRKQWQGPGAGVSER